MSYSLSDEAQSDLNDITEYGIVTFGMEHTRSYLDGLKKHLSLLCEMPEMGVVITTPIRSYRRTVYRNRAIYYVVENDDVVIVRILGAQDSSALL